LEKAPKSRQQLYLGVLDLKRQTWNYLVFLCPKCGSVRYSRSDHKTAVCFRCGYQMLIEASKVQIISKTNEIREAIEAVKRYKMKLAERLSR